jgi:hypothetical protein
MISSAAYSGEVRSDIGVQETFRVNDDEEG